MENVFSKSEIEFQEGFANDLIQYFNITELIKKDELTIKDKKLIKAYWVIYKQKLDYYLPYLKKQSVPWHCVANRADYLIDKGLFDIEMKKRLLEFKTAKTYLQKLTYMSKYLD